MKTLGDLVDIFRSLGDETAIVSRHGLRTRCVSYGALATLCGRFAALNITKGERVIIWGENGADWLAAYFGCLLRGAVPVPLDLSSPRSFADKVAAEVSPKLIAGDRALIGHFAERYRIQYFDEFDKTLPNAGDLSVEPTLVSSDVLQIVFTSGTTAEPKGVVHTHENVLASLRPIHSEIQKYLKYERWVHPLRFLHTLPLSHVFGQFMGLWIPALLGAEVHYESRLVPAALIEKIKRQRLSVMVTVPRVLALMQRELEQANPDLPRRLRYAQGKHPLRRWILFQDIHRQFGFKFWAFICGGAALPGDSERFWNALGFVVIQGYGMTETTALVSVNHPFRVARGSIGQVLPGREIRLSEEGEIEVRGATIAKSVWKDGAIEQLESEWLATGDLAELDSKGNLQFRARKGDVIVASSGVNIHPADLEQALEQQSGIRQAAVLEHAGPNGPEPLAVLIADDHKVIEEAIGNANKTLADYQRIRRWQLWPEPDFPRTSTGKVMKRQIAEQLSHVQTSPEESNEELSLDSLGRLNLQASVEQRHGITLDDNALQNIKTTADLNQLISSDRSAATKTRASANVYPRWPWSVAARIVRSLYQQLIARPLTWLLAKPAVGGSVSPLPRQPLLIVMNHVTAFDVPLALYALPAKIRNNISVAMSGEMLLDWTRGKGAVHPVLNPLMPITYWLVTLLYNVFPLPQASGVRRSFEHIGEAMDRGFHVIVFPEGRRSDDGRLMTVKSGAGLLWEQLGCDLLPIRLHGLGELKQERRWFRPDSIRVDVGHIVSWRAATGVDERTALICDLLLNRRVS